MSYKFFVTLGFTLAAVLSTSEIGAQTPKIPRELYRLCSKFPQNSKCKGLNVPIPLKERKGAKVNCNFTFDPGESKQAGGCKMILEEQEITVYQEQGDKIKLLEDERGTAEIKISRDRIFVTNYQLWSYQIRDNVHRWEVGFLLDDSSSKQHQTNFMTVYLDKDLAESLAAQITSLSTSKPEMVAETLIKADDQTIDVTVLLANKTCQYCDLSNADLSGVDLKGANLQGANLQGANLQDADLKAAYLLGANLQDADLTDANLEGANLTFGTLNRATLIDTDFRGANFQQADLSQADLTNADLRAPCFLKGANLEQANLSQANLRGANLEQANLKQANLTGANLKPMDVKPKDLPYNYNFAKYLSDLSILANMLFVRDPFFISPSRLHAIEGVYFNTNLDGANLEGANLSESNLKKVVFGKANLTNVDFTESKLYKNALESATVCGVTLADGSISDRDCPQ